MKNYAITVNGITYDVTVEEVDHREPMPKRQPAPVPKMAAAKPEAKPVSSGSKKIEAGAAGKVMKISVKAGDQVNSGDTIAVLEIMKMETPIVTSVSGTVTSIEVAVGDMVEAGAVLATLD